MGGYAPGGGPRCVAVGSTNPTKVQAVAAVLARCFPGAAVQGVAVPSGVGAQPLGLAAIRRGALLRAARARRRQRADWGIGMEAGVIVDRRGQAWLCGVAAVVDGQGWHSWALGPLLRLPPAIAAPVLAGQELGTVMDQWTGVPDTKRRGGAIGALTRGLLTRQQAWEVALACALPPLLRPNWYREPS